MMNPKLASWVRSAAIATIVTALMLAVLIVAGEEIPALKDWLKTTFYHHWLGKGALALILFTVTAVAFRFTKQGRFSLAAYIIIETVAVVISVSVIAGYFLLHVMGVV